MYVEKSVLLFNYYFCLNALDKYRPTPANMLYVFSRLSWDVSISYRNHIRRSHMCSVPLILSKLTGGSCGEQDCREMKVNLGCGGKNMDYSEIFFSSVLHCCPTLHLGRQYYRIISSIFFMSFILSDTYCLNTEYYFFTPGQCFRDSIFLFKRRPKLHYSTWSCC